MEREKKILPYDEIKNNLLYQLCMLYFVLIKSNVHVQHMSAILYIYELNYINPPPKKKKPHLINKITINEYISLNYVMNVHNGLMYRVKILYIW